MLGLLGEQRLERGKNEAKGSFPKMGFCQCGCHACPTPPACMPQGIALGECWG